MPSQLFTVNMEAAMREVEIGMGRREVRFPGLLYADDLVLCGELEEDLRVMVGCFVGVCRRGLKVNAGKTEVMVLDGEKGLECEVCVDGIHLEHVSEFKYMECVLDKSGTDEAECNRKVAGGLHVLLGLWLMLGVCKGLH